MKAIILAAGKGSRLGKIGGKKPKCLMEIEDNTLLEIQINTLHNCGIKDISVVRGYEGKKINIPGLNYYENPDYEKANMLHSLFCAREEMDEETLILYSDIIFEEDVVKRIISSDQDIAIGVMVNWMEAIQQRDKVALEELEMLYFDSKNRVEKIGKSLTDKYETKGQFIGIVKCTKWGTEILKRNYDRAKKVYAKKSFGQAKAFKQASLIDVFQEMVAIGVPIYSVIIERGWMEIDTPKDYERALTDTEFVRRLVKIKTNWDRRAKFYNRLDWVNKDQLLAGMVEAAGKLENKKVLDVGTGTGKVLMALKQRNPDSDYYGIDINQSMLDKIGHHHDFKLSVAEMENLDSFKANCFDLVTARMVFHHANDLDKSLNEIYRVLKKGGGFILCEGNPPDRHSVPFYETMFRFKEDRITFTLDDLVNLLVKQGFKNIASRTVILKNMSLNNWLDNSGLPFRNTDIIKKMHYDCDSSVQKAYNMKIKDKDILMDWKFSIVSGVK